MIEYVPRYTYVDEREKDPEWKIDRHKVIERDRKREGELVGEIWTEKKRPLGKGERERGWSLGADNVKLYCRCLRMFKSEQNFSLNSQEFISFLSLEIGTY